MPDELLLLMEKVEQEAKEALAPPAPSYALYFIPDYLTQ